MYPPKAFEESAAAWSVVEAARKRMERIPTVNTLLKTKAYAKYALRAYVTDFYLAISLKHWDLVPQSQVLPNHLAQNEVAVAFF